MARMACNNYFDKRIMKKTIGAIVVDTDRCKGCALCVEACPKDVIALADRKVNAHGYPYVEATHPAECIGCASCGIVCPDGCITVYRKRIEVAGDPAMEQKTV
jgi:2-oxoglutarate ferredoxin oxidoreductase subunit delta